MRFIERLLIRLEIYPWDIVYRALVGFVTLSVFSHVRSGSGSDGVLVPVLLAVFLALRVVPAVARKLLPFSDAARLVWAERRQLAKRYDSYQWQKVLGVGAGLALYVLVSRRFSTPRVAISVMCLVSGVLGTLKWRTTAQQIATARIPAK